ncbi:hypothetical protein vseg_008388 [Gypsophila vaccaria]
MEEMVITNPNNKGKRKIPIEPIINKTKKQVTFSKRRVGLFKKASELCSLCGANVAIVTFSGAGKFFGFGHPSVEDVVQRYINSNKINGNENGNGIDNDNGNGNGNGNGNDFGKCSRKFKDVLGQIEVEKRASSSSNNNNNKIVINDLDNNNIENNNVEFWWDENIDNLGLVELERYKVALEGLRNKIGTKVDEFNCSLMSVVPQNIDFGTRVGNTVAHYQGFDQSTACWVDSGLGRDNFHQVHQVPLSVDSLVDMTMKIQA